MIDYFFQALPVLAALLIYFVRLEIKLATIQRDICWIKKALDKCPQLLEDHML